MVIDVELNIPPKFFDSAKEDNQYESVSERIAKQFIISILNVPNIRRGDDKLKEPDYISGSNGFEVTFAINKSHIPQLKGVKPIDPSSWNIEQELIDNVLDAINRKSQKTYSCPTSLIIITLETLYTWYYSLYTKEIGWFDKIVWKAYTKKRNDFFDGVFENYISTGLFDNIYIIQPTHSKEFALYDIKLYAQSGEGFITRVGITNPDIFPTYTVANVKKETTKEPIKLRTTIINRTKS